MKLIASVLLALFVVGTFGTGTDLPPSAEQTTVLPTANIHTKKTTTTKVPETTTTEAPKTSTTEAPKTSTTEAPRTSTTEAPKTSTTEAPKTSTTEAPKTSTTEAPKTSTTEAPKTSTTEAPKTSTTEAPKTSTTEAPKTSTTEAPKTSTTVKPEPVGKPEVGTWKLLDKATNKTCIIIRLAAQLNFTYTIADNKTNVQIYNLPVNKTSIPNGHCGNGTDDQTIAVSWLAETQNQTNSFAYTFGLKDGKFYLKEAVYAIFTGDFPNGKNESLLLSHVGMDYATAKGYSYHCTREQVLNLTTAGNKTVGTVHVTNVQLEAFHSSASADFSAAYDCDASHGTPDYVPIAVGISLIALVVIVLVAYLVGRRRAQARGYVSM